MSEKPILPDSRERVALELMQGLTRSGVVATGKDAILDLYSECLLAVCGWDPQERKKRASTYGDKKD